MTTKPKKNERQELSAVDAVFKLRFELLWVAPYDIRRSDPAFCEFERWAGRTAALLGRADSGTALRQAVEGLEKSIAWLREERVFPAEVCDEAGKCVSRIAAECGVEL